MTRTEFMRTLAHALFALPLQNGKYLPEAENAAALRYYEEYLDTRALGRMTPCRRSLAPRVRLRS